ncbi:MAG: hypothetical protein HQL20_03305 [Candidatus Omnitrophica bacterium]|nr:hypothetical protein [Candidatus Omnitrophota bacterium]
MKKFFLTILYCVALVVAGGSAGVGLAWAADGAAEPAVRIIKLNFAQVYEVATVLTQMKGADGKVIANEDAKSVVLMDTPERIKAMEDVVRQMDIQTVTVDIPLRFSQANEVLDNVRALLTQSVGAIAADMQKGVITVTDTPVVVDRVRRAVEALDHRGRKIILEAKLVHVVLDDEHLGGVDWSGIVADHQNLRLEGQRAFLGGDGKGQSLSLGTIEGSDFVPLIEALDTVGIVKEYPITDLPVPSGSEVRMVVRMDEPDIALEAADAPDAEPLTPEDAAVEFGLRSEVDVDGTIKTAIITREPAGSVRASDKTRTGARSPSIMGRKPRNATVRSLEGGSIVLGGLIATEKVLTQRKIPVIGDLPLLGFAFRYHNSSVRREEFVILLTPRSVTPEVEPAAPAAKAAVN